MAIHERNRGVNTGALATSLGLVWGLGMWVLGVIATYTETWGHRFIEVMGSIYWGFTASWGGAFVGLFWGFLDAFVGTLVIVWLYKAFSGRYQHTPSTPGGEGYSTSAVSPTVAEQAAIPQPPQGESESETPRSRRERQEETVGGRRR